MIEIGRKRIQLTLRTGHVTYLEYLAERGKMTIHDAIEGLLIQQAPTVCAQSFPPPRKELIHVWLSFEALAVLDKKAIQAGLERSDIARRLIDETQSHDPTI
jgi:hypothetical protein